MKKIGSKINTTCEKCLEKHAKYIVLIEDDKWEGLWNTFCYCRDCTWEEEE